MLDSLDRTWSIWILHLLPNQAAVEPSRPSGNTARSGPADGCPPSVVVHVVALLFTGR
jgi:hypothetical protein